METQIQAAFSAWIDRENRIVSFLKAEGFEEIKFATHEAMFAFVMDKSASGYRIQ